MNGRRPGGSQSIPIPPSSRPAGDPLWRERDADFSLTAVLDALRAGTSSAKQPRPDEKVSAVLMLLADSDDGAEILLTRRSTNLSNHRGEISFPGGRVDPEDRDPIATALRETEEETGLSRQHIEVIGTLPDYLTGTGFRVTPVVALVQPPFELAADVFEVAEIFEVPLDFLMNGANHQRRSAEFPNRPGRRSFYAMPFEHYFIWGATAAMLRNLYHFLRA